MSRGTPDPAGASLLRLRAFHPLRTAFPIPFGSLARCLMQSITPRCSHRGLGSSPFARRYWGNRCYFLFLRVLRCFSSPGSLPHTMDSCTDAFTGGFPHSEIFGSMDICSSPKLIAAYHVFHRLLVPRHPPYALSCLTINTEASLQCPPVPAA